MLHDFQLTGERVRLWQRPGESYEHILMKALGYAMFIGKYPLWKSKKRSVCATNPISSRQTTASAILNSGANAVQMRFAKRIGF